MTNNMTRRAALKLGGQALLTLGALSPAMALAFEGESESVSWERFLELCHGL